MKQKYILSFIGICMLFGMSIIGSLNVFGISEPLDVAGPGKNIMNCSNPIGTGIKDGNLGCYGIWDNGDEFGDDSNMCPKLGYNKQEIGCQIKTKACNSGIATATKYYSPIGMGIKDSQLIEFAKNLQSTPDIVKANIFGLWIYTCGKETPPPVEETGTYKGYLNGSSTPFITTENITETEALKNCKLNSTNNPKKSIYCTWKGDEIFRFDPVIEVSTKKMDCSNPIGTGIKDGDTACYGVWDYGSAYGDDRNMCQDKNYKSITGCLIKTKACSSGVATAVKYYTPRSMDSSDTTIETLAENMETSVKALKEGMAGMWLYTCGKTTVPTEETGSLSVKVNGSSVMTGMDMTRSVALTKCKEKATYYPNSEVSCTWNNEQIYYVPAPEKTGSLTVKVNGSTVMTGMDMTRSVALTKCKEKAAYYPNSEVSCTWNNEQIYYVPAPEKTAIFIAYQDGIKIGGKKMTKKAAEEECNLMHILSTKSELRCIWDGVEFYNNDDTPEYCQSDYEYFNDLDRCVKSSYFTYYSLMNREYGYTISKISISKLKTIIERIEDIEEKYSTNSAILLKLEALKLVIEVEIRKQEGDDFDFEDLFN